MNNFKYLSPKNEPISSPELIEDLKKVAKKEKTTVLTQSQYTKNGKYDVTTISRRFGSWKNALGKAKLLPGNISNYTDEELYENILNIWQHKGKQPVRLDLDFAPSIISQSPYNRRFKSWSNALKSFVGFVQSNGTKFKPTSAINKSRKTNRDPSLSVRYNVLKRDHFKCVICGKSPAKTSGVELHIDHIIPWSKGGETTLKNLRTLCSKCNLGKSSLP